jgi:hypothetical protein
MAQLRAVMPYVYVARTQPAHEEFPCDWRQVTGSEPPVRAVFIASRQKLDGNDRLLDYLPDVHEPL